MFGPVLLVSFRNDPNLHETSKLRARKRLITKTRTLLFEEHLTMLGLIMRKHSVFLGDEGVSLVGGWRGLDCGTVRYVG